MTEATPQRTTPGSAPAPSLAPAIAAGLVAAVVGGALWAAVVDLTHYKTGIMAIVVGVLVGWAVRMGGRHGGSTLAVVGALLAGLGCVLGTLFTVAVIGAGEAGISTGEAVLRVLAPANAVTLLGAASTPMDLVFYAIAIYEGYKFAGRPAA